MFFPEGVREVPAAHAPEFRRRALDRSPRATLSCRRRLISGSASRALRNWMCDAIDSGRKSGVTTDEYKELVELRRRHRVLEMEVDILKRASAYFARENVLPKGVPAGPGARRRGVFPSRWPAGS